MDGFTEDLVRQRALAVMQGVGQPGQLPAVVGSPVGEALTGFSWTPPA
jgi:hypothetical protein